MLCVSCRVLPVFMIGDVLSFTALELDPQLLQAIEACGFETPSPIQSQAIPPTLSGQDVMASAPTGTGKTAAFVLPSLQRLLTPSTLSGNGPRVLVLTPTRELAGQVASNIRELGRFTRLRSDLIVGGVPYPPQIKALKRPVDFLIATPGRLIDHMDAGRLDFSRLELLILDEADRMLDMGFLDDVNRIAQATPKQRQTLLFSATLEGPIESVARRLLKDPQRIQVSGVKVKHDAIKQHIHQADDFRHKMALLSHTLQDSDIDQAIIFTATKRGADELSTRLREYGHRCAALHGDMRMGQRLRVVDQLQRNKIKLLVATDVAARGLDVRGISHVINFDMPMAAEDYIHRIGRTGRGGSTGTAVSLVGPNDWGHLKRIEQLTGNAIEKRVLEGLEPRRPIPRDTEKSRNGRRQGNKKRHSAGPGKTPRGRGARNGKSQNNTVTIRYVRSSAAKRGHDAHNQKNHEMN